MADRAVPADLQQALQQVSEPVHRPKGTVLFRRGDKAAGMYVLVSGRVRVDLGVDSSRGSSYGPGALVGLPSTLTSNNYSLTATVTEDAFLSFITPVVLNSLLRDRPDLCRLLLAMLGEIIAVNNDQQRRLLNGDQHAVSPTSEVLI